MVGGIHISGSSRPFIRAFMLTLPPSQVDAEPCFRRLRRKYIRTEKKAGINLPGVSDESVEFRYVKVLHHVYVYVYSGFIGEFMRTDQLPCPLGTNRIFDRLLRQ